MTLGTWNFRVYIAGVLKFLIYIYGKCENLNFLGTPLKDKCSTLCYDDAKLKRKLLFKEKKSHDSQYFASSEYFTSPFIQFQQNTSLRPVMGKLFKEGAKGKEKNFRRANIIY